LLETPSLEASQVEEFRRDGCLWVKGAFGPASVDQLGLWADELLARPEQPGRHWVYHEKSVRDGSDRVQRIENISPFHAGFAELERALRQSAAQLLGEPAELFKEKINYKQPGGDGFKPHQDSQAGWERYASYFLTVAVAIDACTPENGCLEIARGQQRPGLGRTWEPLSEEELAGIDFEPIPAAPGDLVFVDSYAPHRSFPNRSELARRLYFATYNRRSEGRHLEQYYADKRKSFPPDVERDPKRTYVFRV
jgi:hypothetical protein